MAEEKERFLDQFYPIGEDDLKPYAKGSARNGCIVCFTGSEHDLGWNIELTQTEPCELETEERNELLPVEPQRFLPGSVLS